MFSANSSQVSDEKLYVEDVFSTYLYTGTGAAQTITNGIDLAGKGGLVWIKSRSAATANFLFDTSRGVNVEINSNTTDANATLANSLTAFNSNGFSISSATGIGVNAATYASWTFREAPKFFDVVTYTGDNVSGRAIPHNLGVAPGCMFIKPTNAAGSWIVYHRSTGATKYLVLQSTGQEASSATIWGGANPTATQFTIGGSGAVNETGTNYVAYLFAHDTDALGLIQCGSFTTDGSGNATVNLGWEPQFIIGKSSSAADPWYIADIMRGMPVSDSTRTLRANETLAEQGLSPPVYIPNATGFSVAGGLTASTTYIYIAIRRGPMRIPTSGTSVFNVNISDASGSSTNPEFTSSFPVDSYFFRPRTGTSFAEWIDRLRGLNVWYTQDISAESTYASEGNLDIQSGAYKGNLSTNYFATMFRRAPSFYDVVCYSGTGSNTTVSHSLGVAPELMIVKRRNGTGAWQVYSAGIANSEYLVLSSTAAKATGTTRWNSTTPGSANFTVGTDATVNASGGTYTAYLFASCPGVSKIGSYTGNGSSQTINCGFAAGARFVMIKRTDSTGDWYVWDSSRGIVAGNDPHLSMNTTAAEVTTDDSVDTDSSGFVVNQLSATNINVSSATYIYLAVA